MTHIISNSINIHKHIVLEQLAHVARWSVPMSFIVLIIILYSSCSTQDKFRAQQLNDYKYYYAENQLGEDYNNLVLMSHSNKYLDNIMTNEEMRAWGERTYIRRVEYKMQIMTSKKDKYNQELQQEKDL